MPNIAGRHERQPGPMAVQGCHLLRSPGPAWIPFGRGEAAGLTTNPLTPNRQYIEGEKHKA